MYITVLVRLLILGYSSCNLIKFITSLCHMSCQVPQLVVVMGAEDQPRTKKQTKKQKQNKKIQMIVGEVPSLPTQRKSALLWQPVEPLLQLCAFPSSQPSCISPVCALAIVS